MAPAILFLNCDGELYISYCTKTVNQGMDIDRLHNYQSFPARRSGRSIFGYYSLVVGCL